MYQTKSTPDRIPLVEPHNGVNLRDLDSFKDQPFTRFKGPSATLGFGDNVIIYFHAIEDEKMFCFNYSFKNQPTQWQENCGFIHMVPSKHIVTAVTNDVTNNTFIVSTSYDFKTYLYKITLDSTRRSRREERETTIVEGREGEERREREERMKREEGREEGKIVMITEDSYPMFQLDGIALDTGIRPPIFYTL